MQGEEHKDKNLKALLRTGVLCTDNRFAESPRKTRTLIRHSVDTPLPRA